MSRNRSIIFSIAVAVLSISLYAADEVFYQSKPDTADWVVTWKATNGTITIEARDGTVIRAENGVNGYAAKKFTYTPADTESFIVTVKAAASFPEKGPLFYVMGRDEKGKTILYESIGRPAADEKILKQFFTMSRAVRTFEVGLDMKKMTGEVVIKDLRIERFTPSPEAIALTKPKGPTRWAATSIDRTYGISGFDPRWKDTALKLLACAGINSTRAGVNWKTSEPERGKFDYSDFTDRMKLFEYYGIEYSIACLGSTPSWASGKDPDRDISDEIKKKLGAYKVSNSYWAPKDWNDWERFVEGAVKAGKGTVKVWEILNEPDLYSEGFMGTYEEYREYVRHAYIAAKRADPKCRVFLGAFVYSEWLPQLFRDGWTNWFDGICTHPYSGTGEGCVNRNNGAIYTTITFGAPKEAWITEVGFQSGGWKEGPGCVKNEDEKAREGRIALEGLAKQSEFIAWYTAQERGNMFGLNRIEKNWALRPMPIFYELGDVTGKLKKSGGPVSVTVLGAGKHAVGESFTVRLVAKNTGDKKISVKLWPAGFIEALGTDNAGPNAQDFNGTMAAGEEKVIEVRVRPTDKAKDAYPVGLAVICDAGNSLALADIEIGK
ncbi:MAG: beta-galactosidase [Spirochaetes bacterium]|nr:beta-galactosidase [Spirochaetota bacterium]